jgi:hypothetical protein
MCINGSLEIYFANEIKWKKQKDITLSEQFQNSIGKITVRDKIDTINTRIQVHDSSFYCLSTDTSENLFRKLIFSHSYWKQISNC